MQLTQALTLVPERKRDDKDADIGSARMSMDSVIEFLTGPVRDIPLIEFDLPKILAFYSKKGKDDSEIKESMTGVVDYIKQTWDDTDDDGLVSTLIEKVVTKATRRLGMFIARLIFGTIWRITKWLVKEVVGGVIKNVLRYLVMPALEAVVGFLFTPVGLALALVGGALGGAYLVYNAFFAKKEEKPKTGSLDTDDLGSGTTSVADNLLRKPEGATSTPGDSSVSAAPARTAQGSLTTAAEAPMGAGAPVASGPPPSSDVKKMIISHEGVKLEPYKDSLGLWTIGVGHLIGDGKTLPDAWNRKFSKEEVYALFDQDFEHHKNAAMQIPNFNRLGEKAQAAFIDLTFNMGPGWYRRWPKLVQAMRDFDIRAVIDNLRTSKWAKQVQASRVSDVLSLLSTELTGTSAASDTPKVTPGTMVPAATTTNQIKNAQAAARPGVAVPPPGNEKTILKTPSGQLVAANMN
jgi:GH24 family phage-related lysozyme (muramidase)